MKLFKSLSSNEIKANLLWCWVMMLLLLPNICLLFTENVPAAPWAVIAAKTAFLLVPAAVYLLLTTLTRNVGKTVCIVFILIFLSAFQIVLLNLFSRSVIAVDMWLNLVTTNADEAGELLGAMAFAIAFVVIFYLPPLVLSVFAWRAPWLLPRAVVRTSRLVALVIGVVGCLLLAAVLITQPRVKLRNDLYPVNVIYNAFLASERVEQSANYQSTSASFTYNARHLRPDSVGETYILVIGETARAANFQLFGYPKPTTPDLIGRHGLHAFKNAMSESNTTHKSVPMLLSHIDSRNFGDSIYRVKGLAQAFREAGFHTAFFSNQQRNGSFIDFFGQQADTCVFLRDNFHASAEQCPKDKELLPLVKNELATDPSPKKLIILHTYGSHFRYDDRYPRQQAPFPVDGELDVSPKCRDRLIAAYDNTIHYTASLLSELMNMLETDTGHPLSGLIYTSDHGEDIYDNDGSHFLHASPLPSIYQVSVPMIVWLSDEFERQNPIMAQAAENNASEDVSSTRAVFHTLLHMAGLDATQLDTTQSLLSPVYAEPNPRLYLNDHNRPVALADLLH
ncbi:MAG: lipid A phosphoethanolamine transferase [Muribaculum sp.]|nr:lipid A phosphoethanolamine transferase [Muribaculaceae bacterium]MCM1080785.1 lipid A phosphoethanolamine transferase [Muribaculum sp.]